MQVQSISVNYPSKTNKQLSFGKAYPVVHWVSEKGGRHFEPVVTEDLTRILQSKLVRKFNKHLMGLKADKIAILKPVQEFLRANDPDYRQHKITRSFYDEKGGWSEEGNKFNPISYMMTGIDAFSFEQTYGKPVGLMKKKSPRLLSGRRRSVELTMSQKEYNEKGLNFVKARSELAKNNLGENVSLHTKYILHRDKNGKKSWYYF